MLQHSSHFHQINTLRLKVTDSQVIIDSSESYDDWWDLKQLMAVMVHIVKIIKVTHLGKIGIFLFRCTSAHEGLASDTFKVNKMNINPRGKQPHLWSTTIHLNNSLLQPGQLNIQGQLQIISCTTNHPDPSL